MSVVLALALAAAGAVRVDAPLTLSATAPVSAQETSLVPYVGPRVSFVNDAGPGTYYGGEGTLALGFDSQGTSQVGVSRYPVLLEGRGLLGQRMVLGLVGLGGYGFAGLGAGGGFADFRAFATHSPRLFGLTTVRVGGGGELALGPVLTRIELGLGAQNLRFEVSGSLGVGVSF